jgi:hypothetical protein
MRRVILCLILAACGGGDDDGGGDDVDPIVATVGPEGGSVEGGGVSLTIPSGALTDEQEITITVSSQSIAGFTMYTPVYTFAPDGLTFEAPIEVAMDVDQEDAYINWTVAGGSTFEMISSQYVDSRVVGNVDHFSRGFAGRAGETGGDDCEGGCAGDQVCVNGVCQDY